MDDFNKDRVKRLGIFFLCLVIAAVLTFFIKEPDFTDSQVYVLFLLFFAIGLWVSEVMPAFAVSLIIISFLVFALGNEHLNAQPENIAKYANTFSSSVIWLMLGGFFLAKAMSKTKLDEALFRFAVKISGNKARTLLLGLMMTTMLVSMLMANTAITAMMIAAVMPLVTQLGKESKFTKALLLGIPTASTAGGFATIIGSPVNAIAVGALELKGLHVSFIDWVMYGLPLAIVLTVISWVYLAFVFLKNDEQVSLSFLEKVKQESSQEFNRQRKVVIFVIIVTVSLWLTSSLHGITVAGVCAVPLVFLTLTRVIEGKDVQTLPWDTLLLIAGGLSLGLALEQTGLLSHYGEMLITMDLSAVLLIWVFAYFTMMVSNVMSGTAASAIMIPMGMAILLNYQIDISIIMAFGASCALLLPVSSPSNAIAYSTGYLEQKDFIHMGLLIGLLGPLLSIFWVLYVS
ncbi:MAG: DASS family sodium-coupled anion symporter [Lutimonas sp.]|jgi:solute carrier family 13 (sodium-dependent dicarboxylate transporter), member 2/3/5